MILSDLISHLIDLELQGRGELTVLVINELGTLIRNIDHVDVEVGLNFKNDDHVKIVVK